MAKHITPEYYTFTPSTKTIVINRYLRQEQLMLITNTTRNTVLFNFSDPTYTLVSFISTITNNVPTTTVVLKYDTTSVMQSTDKIAILVEESNETFQPMEILMDPVNKLRTSSPQALIDTDFEYSTQTTKWESIALINNRPFAYYNTYNPLAYTDVTATNLSRTVTVTSTANPTVGTPVFIQDTTWAGADGLFMIETSSGSNFTYTARIAYPGTTGSINNANTTNIYQGYVFTGASISLSTVTYSGTVVTVTCSVPHGLLLGNEIGIIGLTASTNAPNGSWTVATVTSPTVFTYNVISTPTGTIAYGSATLYVRPQGNFLHRAFDGGVTFSTNASSHNQQLIRQTRRYFRYQSGKGIQMSTGTLLKPNLNLDSITAVGAVITVVTKVQHNINPGITITISGLDQTAYNGTYTVASVIDPYKFTYISTNRLDTTGSTPSIATPTGLPYLSVSNWYGANTRVGMFDNQNGVFFEYDGQTIYAVRRSSTYQINGWASINAGSNSVTGITLNGVSPIFSKQLVPGDYVVIKGMSYKVETIASDSSMTIQPPYRGSVNLSAAVISKTIDYRVPQSSWNIDRADGTGVSGFTLDLSRMQMFYLDYSWYGAGFIRWGFRGLNGDVMYCHKSPNNNVNYQAYMRSGNLPARYESNTFSKSTQLANIQANGGTTLGSSDVTIYVNTLPAGWPMSGAGIAVIRNATAYEYVNFAGVGTANIAGQYTVSTLTGVTRAQAGGTLTFTTNTATPVISGVSTAGVQIGQYVFSTTNAVPANTFVVSFVVNTSVTLSQAPMANGSSSLIFSPMAGAAQSFTYSATAPIAVDLHAPLFASTISHWGTSVIMDGRFDDDKSYVFTRGMTTTLAINNGVNNAVMSFRIAPSVSSGVAGSTLGIRELVNRMQMILRQLDVFSNGQFLMTLVLNGTVSSATPNWASVGGSSLAQYIFHTSATTIAGGETVFGFFLNTTGSGYTTTQQDLTLVRDMGTSILGGGVAAANVGVYPDGPDVITVMAQNIGTGSGNIFARLSWTEAQA